MIIMFILLSFVISAWITRVLSNPSSKFLILDYPNERSLHSFPISRTGGLAICLAIGVSGTTASFYLEFDASLACVAIGAMLIATVSFLDDRFKINAVYRFIAHAVSASLLLIVGFAENILELPGWQWTWPKAVGVLFSLLFVIWLINLFNFMDGMDGLAGGMTVFGFGTFSVFGWETGNVLFSLLSLIIAASAAGFLVFNFPPAKIFMGDVGSSTLGFLVAAFSLWASRQKIIPLWLAVLVFSPFIVDATVTLIRRLLRREKIWEAHKSHYYQRIVLIGWGHRRTLLWEYVLMAACSISAVLARYLTVSAQWFLIVAWILIYVILLTNIPRLEVVTSKNK